MCRQCVDCTRWAVQYCAACFATLANAREANDSEAHQRTLSGMRSQPFVLLTLLVACTAPPQAVLGIVGVLLTLRAS